MVKIFRPIVEIFTAWPKANKFGRVTRGEGRISRGQPRPISKKLDASVPNFRHNTYAHMVWSRATKLTWPNFKILGPLNNFWMDWIPRYNWQNMFINKNKTAKKRTIYNEVYGRLYGRHTTKTAKIKRRWYYTALHWRSGNQIRCMVTCGVCSLWSATPHIPRRRAPVLPNLGFHLLMPTPVDAERLNTAWWHTGGLRRYLIADCGVACWGVKYVMAFAQMRRAVCQWQQCFLFYQPPVSN